MAALVGDLADPGSHLETINCSVMIQYRAALTLDLMRGSH